MRGRVPVILQTASADCGVAAVGMLLAGQGHPIPVGELREMLDAGRDGLSLRDLRDTVISYGLRCRVIALPALREDPRRLRDLPLPLIAHWHGDHYVVVDRLGRRGIGMVDPAVGRRWLPLAEFAAGATGVVLLAEPPDPRQSDARQPDPRQSDPHPGAEQPGQPRPGPARPSRQRDRVRRDQVGNVRLLLLPMLRPHRPMLALLAAVSVLMTVAGLAVPLFTSRVVDQLAASRGPGYGWFVAVAGLAVATGALSLWRGLMVTGLQRRIGRQAGRDTVEHLFRAAYRYFERRSAGDLIDRVRAAVAIRDLLASSLVATALDALLAVTYLTVVTVLAPVLGAVTAAMMAVQLGVAGWLASRAGALQREELLAAGEESGRLADALRGMAAIRSAGAGPRVFGRWLVYFDRGIDASHRLARLSAVSDAVLSAWQVATPVLMLLVAAGGADSPGAAVGLAALAAAAVAPAGMLAVRLPAFTLLSPTLERLADIIQAPAEQPDPRPPAPRLAGRISLERVGFQYDRRSRYAVRGVTVTIEPGMKVAIVGGSGSGKSTLIALLTGLHRPTEGTIRYDGHDITGIDLASLRRQLGIVLQDSYVGAGTIRDALTLSHPEATEEQIEHAAHLAAVHDDIRALPMGYDTRLGDGGAGLSGGQRQRVALARALLGEPAVLLLDEATSALDTVTEATVESRVRGLPMTRVVVAHRMSTVVDADLVLVMEQGCIVEYGPPAELTAAGGRFATLVTLAVR